MAFKRRGREGASWRNRQLHVVRSQAATTLALTLLSALLLLLLPIGGASDNAPAQLFVLEPLPYDYGALEPVISRQIMQLHHDFHEGVEYVNTLNGVLGPLAGSGTATLPDLIKMVGRGGLSPDTELVVRNFGGGHWNHQMFWKLQNAINGAFGSTDEMLPFSCSAPYSTRFHLPSLPTATTTITTTITTTAMITAIITAHHQRRFKLVADGHFGSGWSWLCVQSDGGLRILDTANQDNPLMGVVLADPCTPILGIDVWEHAYYLEYGPKKPDYTSAWLNIINWKQVSANYDSARRGDLAAIGTDF
ncbi:superoxide dismutase [Mn] [Volvox carteri f. nagariensis]|uniref:superoxide dismutase n=1 Tax=Volvox carteri f. nagariensis TaxID=3068 RepID=D8TYG8_VOLCA|nr:superoxide dismutase [Mn] [Volvox carteri f. nagariensis]EFJ47551.1 superoxide dismutase [Mn] [Volvox carteri f. nagariensis]|eukprot:XP_002951375.1 superoxide dismutase [Mn] [Volvox carteri f. nagariensis]